MAARLLMAAVSAAVLVVACQVGPVAIVDCRTTKDCALGEVCSAQHACVDPETEPGMTSTPLAWDLDSSLADNPFGFRGGWYLSNDCLDVQKAVAEGRFVCPPSPPTPECCTLLDTSLMSPWPDEPAGVSVRAGTVSDGQSRICVKGTVAQILNDVTEMPAFGVQWGAIAALSLNVGLAFDTTAAFPGGKMLGFSFDLDGPPSPQPVRVGINTRTNDLYFIEVYVPVHGGQMLFSELALGDGVMPQVPFAGDEATVLGFDVAAIADSTLPLDFCVSNLRVLQEGNAASTIE